LFNPTENKCKSTAAKIDEDEPSETYNVIQLIRPLESDIRNVKAGEADKL